MFSLILAINVITNSCVVCRPAVSEGELHPEEGKVPQVTAEDWAGMLNTAGQLEDDLPLRKVVASQS